MGELHGGLGSEHVEGIFSIIHAIAAANAGEYCPDPLAQA